MRRIFKAILFLLLLIYVMYIVDISDSMQRKINYVQANLESAYKELEYYKDKLYNIDYDGEIVDIYDKIDDLYENKQDKSNQEANKNICDCTHDKENNAIEELENKIKELEGKVNMLECEAKEYGGVIENLEVKIENAENIAEELSGRIKELEDKIIWLESEIKRLEDKIKELEYEKEKPEDEPDEEAEEKPKENVSNPSEYYNNGIYEDISHLYYGRLYIPDLSISVALYYGHQQYITDRKDSANIFCFEDFRGYTISDHNYQEFSKLLNVKTGMRGYIQNKYVGRIDIVCTDVFNGRNNGAYIVDENGANAMNMSDYMMYTCRNSSSNVLICLWEIVRDRRYKAEVILWDAWIHTDNLYYEWQKRTKRY